MRLSTGFTLLEVIIALGILTSAVYALTRVQMNTLRRLRADRQEIDRMYLVKKEWYQAYIKEWKTEGKPVTKKYTAPLVDIVTMCQSLKRFLVSLPQKKGESKAKPDEQPLQVIVSAGTWKNGEFDEKISLVGVRYQPIATKKKNNE